MANNLNFLLGKPLEFRDGIFIYPPTINDSLIAEFNQYLTLLTVSYEDIEDMFEQQLKDNKDFILPTPYEFLMLNAYNNKEYEDLAKRAFQFFTKETVTFIYDQKLILYGNVEKQIAKVKSIDDLIFFKEDDFIVFQNMIRLAVGHSTVDPPDPNMHPKKKRMLALARLRDRIKAKQNAKKGATFDDTVVAICCMGFGLNPLNIGELSYCAVSALIECYQNKEKYELDIQSLLAGADSKKVHPKYWIGVEK